MITREDLIEQSVTDYARQAIFTTRGYPASEVEMIESFPYDYTGHLDKNKIAVGFNFDDLGEPAELGSTLLRRLYTIEFFVLGLNATYGRNLAHALKFALQTDLYIPLKDIAVPVAPPVVDQLEVIGVRAARQVIQNPQPWQEFIWLTTLHVQDTYFAALV